MKKKKFLTAVLVMITFTISAQNRWIKLKEETIKISGKGQYSIQLVSLAHDSTVLFEHVTVDSKPIFVRFDGRYDKTFENAITVSKFSQGSKIEMKINLDSLRASGNYTGALKFSYAKAGGRPKVCEADFTIVRPAAKLESSETIKLKISGGDLVNVSPFSIWETGGISDVRNLKLISPDISGVSVANLIEFKPDIITVLSNSKKQIEYGLRQGISDDLPFGKLSGRMHITSPEFPNQLVVSWEIVNRCHPAVIFFLILGGAFLGTFVRSILVPAKSVLESRIKATNQLQIMYAFIKNSIQDSTWSIKFTMCAGKLSDALTDRYVVSNTHREDIEAALANVTTEFKELQKQFSELVNQTRTRVGMLSVLFKTDLKIMEQEFKDCKEGFKKAQKNLEEEQISMAEQACSSTERSLHHFANKYANRLKTLSALLTPDRLFPTFLSEKVTFETWLTQIKSQLVFENAESLEDVKKFIIQAEMFKFNMEKLSKSLIDTVSTDISNTPDPNIDKAFKNWELEISSSFLSDTLDVTDLFIRLMQSKLLLEKAFGTVSGSSGLATTQAGTTNNQNSNTDDSGIDSGLITPKQLPTVSMDPRKVSVIMMAERDKLAFWRVNALRLFIVSGLMSVAAYGLYYNDFIGSVPEMISIFVFAFGLDITVESIKSISSKNAGA